MRIEGGHLVCRLMETDASPLLREGSGDVITLRLNRPDRLNAVNLPMYEALEAALQDVADERSVRVVVLTGSGRAFCVGADLKAHGEAEPSAGERRTYVETGQRVYQLIQNLTKPVIAAVNGHAIGAGLELALSCDFIVVADEGKLRLPEIGLGTFVGGGTTYTLSQRVGLAKAKELILLGRAFSGADAVEMGLANLVVPPDRVVQEALRLAEDLSKKAPISMALAKRLLNRARDMDSETAMRLEAEALLECMDTRDWREGIEAFQEKREPRFTGE